MVTQPHCFLDLLVAEGGARAGWRKGKASGLHSAVLGLASCPLAHGSPQILSSKRNKHSNSTKEEKKQSQVDLGSGSPKRPCWTSCAFQPELGTQSPLAPWPIHPASYAVPHGFLAGRALLTELWAWPELLQYTAGALMASVGQR